MRDTYSLYDAKAHLSAIVRQVREGRTAVITLHGEPVAEIRPIAKGGSRLDRRLAEMIANGTLVPASNPRAPFGPVARRPGALKRFLADRNE